MLALLVVALVGNCSLSPAPEDNDGRLSPVPGDDETPSVVPATKDDKTLGAVPILKDDGILSPAVEDDVVIGDIGIEKFSVGCLICELLVLPVDRAFGRAKLNVFEVLLVVLPTSEGIAGTVKLLLVTIDVVASAGWLVSLPNIGTGNTTDGC